MTAALNGGIICPSCGSSDNGVTDSRPTRKGLRRVRSCNGCGTRMRTIETVAAFNDTGVHRAGAGHFTEIGQTTADVNDLARRVAAVSATLILDAVRAQIAGEGQP